MANLLLTELVLIVKTFYQKLIKKFSESCVRNYVPTKMHCLGDMPKHGPQRTTVQETVYTNPSIFIQLRKTLGKILHKDLHLFPCKIQLKQELLSQDRLHLHSYANRML